MPFILGPSLLPEPNDTAVILNKTLGEDDYDYKSYLRLLLFSDCIVASQLISSPLGFLKLLCYLLLNYLLLVYHSCLLNVAVINLVIYLEFFSFHDIDYSTVHPCILRSRTVVLFLEAKFSAVINDLLKQHK